MAATNPVQAFTEAILRADAALASRLGMPLKTKLAMTYDDRDSQQQQTVPSPFAITAPQFTKVDIQDLDSAIIHSFTVEIGQRGPLTAEQFTALKRFVTAVIRWVSVKPSTLAGLQRLNYELQRRPSITGAEIVLILESGGLRKSQGEIEWHNCRSTTPNRRGYPCGLWQVFHTMTVRAYEESDTDPQTRNAFGPEAEGSLTAIVGYIQHFFACGECSRNFMKGVQKIRGAQTGQAYMSNMDAVLFMWRSHNTANKFLAGDQTEDPSYPKVQFPTPAQCSACRISQHGTSEASAIDWDQENVVEFLRRFYGAGDADPVDLLG